MTEPPPKEPAAKDDAVLDDSSGAPNFRRGYLKTAVVVLFLACVVALLNLSGIGEHLNVDALRAMVDGTGMWAPLVFFAVTAASIFIGAPRLIFCAAGGALFGFVEGFILSQLATIVGSLGPFLFARWAAREWVAAKLAKFKAAQRYLQNPSILDVFLIRHLPIWGVFINMLLGSNGVRLRTFLAGSFLGFLPQGIVFTLVGSGIGEESTMMVASRTWGAILVLVVAAVITRRVTRRV